jgi:serine/threonine-protein kinase
MDKKVFNQHVKSLFDSCMDVTDAEAQRKIIQSSEFSDDVKIRVTNLLKHQDNDDSLIEQSIIETTKHGLNTYSVQAGDSIEHYQLINPIGEGGQGEVWLAQRNDGEFNHNVAIKFIKVSHNEKELQRFQSERELLASLQHANIAGLIGGGKLNDRLYMIMEWIDGIPLIEYLKQNTLTLSQTLKLFLQICQAVSFAHSKGIIHRDIKPSNILVDKQGTVKLLDFGIAKTINADVTQNQSATMMTLAYSSPEQIKGQTVSTATDVYALGLILYEMLTNHRAQNHTTESAAEYIRIISDITPVKPSMAEPEEKNRFPVKKLQGDLDNLVMMSIRKEPERRYKNVDAFINDIQNYLQKKPLLASGDSWSYKTSKLLKRNPLASMLTAAVLVFLIGLPIIMYDASIKLKAESQIANATSEFITTVLKSATPLVNKGEDLNMADVMQQAEKDLLAGTVKNPKVEAKLYRIFASIQHSLENNPKSIEYYQKAADISKKLGDYEGQLSSLGQKAVMYFFNNDVENGNEAFRQADKVSKKVNNPVELAWHNLRKSTNEYTKGNYQLALDLAQNALDEMQSRNNNNPEILGRIYNELAIATSEFSNEKSLPYRDKAIEYAEIFHGKLHPIYLSRTGNKIYSLLKIDRYDEAEKLLAEAMPLAEKLFTKDHPKYAFLLAKVTELQFKQGEYEKAEETRKQANDLFIKFYGDVSFNHVFGVTVLGEIYEAQGKNIEAKKLYLRAIEIRTTLDANNLIRLAKPQKNLARLMVKTGDYKAALDLINHVIEVHEKYKKDNLYNHITKAAAIIGDGNDSSQCQLGMKQLAGLLPDLKTKPVTNWEPMLAEIWVAEIAMKCGNTAIAKNYILPGFEKSKQVYKQGSIGQKLIANRTNNVLEKIRTSL